MKEYFRPSTTVFEVGSSEVVAASPDFGTQTYQSLSFDLDDNIHYRTRLSGGSTPQTDGNGDAWGDATGYRSGLWD